MKLLSFTGFTFLNNFLHSVLPCSTTKREVGQIYAEGEVSFVPCG